jgi:hypothetical protein
LKISSLTEVGQKFVVGSGSLHKLTRLAARDYIVDHIPASAILSIHTVTDENANRAFMRPWGWGFTAVVATLLDEGIKLLICQTPLEAFVLRGATVGAKQVA